MPGIVDPCSIGLHREVGKMTFPNQDLVGLDFQFTEEETADLEKFAEFMASDKSNTVIDSMLSESTPSLSSSSPSRDNNESEGELPESEHAFDLEKFLDTRNISGIMLSDHFDEYYSREDSKLKQPSINPFMGMQDNSTSEALLNHSTSLEDQLSHSQTQKTEERFVAWCHTPSEDDDDEHLLMLITNSLDDDCDETLPDTPSSYSGSVTGDDSDVDIETITDLPRTADVCGYVTQDSSPALTPANSPSPLQNHANNTIHRSQSSPLFSSSSQSSNGSQPLLRYNSCGVSSSASLAENLMCGRPGISAQKRKLQKEKKYSCKNTVSYHQSTTFQSSGGSVNFHDYAMSPVSCSSLDTAQPTVITSKRLTKRRQLNTLDLSEKEKQHHHNQLERNRRQKLADLFIDLRDVVPNITNQTKASKVMILNQATTYIEDLQKHESNQVVQISKEVERNQFLKRQKRQLESQLSSVK